MSDGIFVLNGEQLVEMIQQPYDTEDVFQALLAKYLNLLAGGQLNRADPRRWLLVPGKWPYRQSLMVAGGDRSTISSSTRMQSPR